MWRRVQMPKRRRGRDLRRTVHPWVESGRIESTTNELGQTGKIRDPASLPIPRGSAAVRSSAIIGGTVKSRPPPLAEGAF